MYHFTVAFDELSERQQESFAAFLRDHRVDIGIADLETRVLLLKTDFGLHALAHACGIEAKKFGSPRSSQTSYYTTIDVLAENYDPAYGTLLQIKYPEETYTIEKTNNTAAISAIERPDYEPSEIQRIFEISGSTENQDTVVENLSENLTKLSNMLEKSVKSV